mmetsp:Transcript_21827/g.21559  ORF Transcript_21827/g.21559 Transcript_21827/m.21559 type:complete len:133 (-) Transcript_21827:333-731(-)
MKVQFANSDTPIYATVILWGLLGDVVKNAEKLRKLFKSARYAVSAAKIFLTSWKMKTYKCNVQFKSDFETNSDFNARKHLDEEDGKNDVGLNISSSIQTESTEATEGSEIGENPWNDHPDSDFSFLGMVTHE